MYIMAQPGPDGKERKYLSDYCINHPQLERNFKGNKRDMVTGELTAEYKKHMDRIRLDIVEKDGKKVAICPRCFLQFQIK